MEKPKPGHKDKHPKDQSPLIPHKDQQPKSQTIITPHNDKVKFVHRTEPDLTPKVSIGDTEGLENDDLNLRPSIISLEEHLHHQQVHLDAVHDPEPAPQELGLGDVGDIYDPDLLNELVLYDKLGNPYVDIFKLMFNHKKIRKLKKPEELTFKNYTPDLIFLVGKLITFVISAVTLLTGYSVVTLITSVESTFTNNILDDLDPSNLAKVPILTFSYIPKLMKTFPHAGLDKLTTGYILIVSSCANTVNSIIGIYTSVQLYPKLVILHAVVNMLILLTNFFVSFSYPECNQQHAVKFGNKLLHYIHSYTIMYESEIYKDRAQFGAIQLDEIQVSLDCCGAFSWLDYLDEGVIVGHKKFVADVNTSGPYNRELRPRRELSNIEFVLPPTCCKLWWIKNIHCSVGLHKYAHPTAKPEQLKYFNHRISEKGCVPAVMEVCKRTAELVEVFLPISCGVHFGFFVLECIAIHIVGLRVSKLVREKLQAAKREAAEQTGEGYSDTSLTFEQPKKAGDGDQEITTKNVPLPTEDQIQLIKSRSDFNKFEATMAYTHVGEWISAARRAVFKGNRRTHHQGDIHFDLKHLTGSRISLKKSFIKPK